jgi:cathepsin A (carboxypeptidase C)
LTNPELQYPWYPEMVWNNSHHIQVVNEDTYEAMKSVVPHCTSLIAKCNSGDGMINTFACQSAFVLCNMGLTYVVMVKFGSVRFSRVV